MWTPSETDQSRYDAYVLTCEAEDLPPLSIQAWNTVRFPLTSGSMYRAWRTVGKAIPGRLENVRTARCMHCGTPLLGRSCDTCNPFRRTTGW